MLKVGITGGIGSGKSTVCQVFTSLKVPVYYADQQAKLLAETDPEIRYQIMEVFGSEAYLDAVYNTTFIANRVFSDKTLLNRLNSIIHPAVAKDFNIWTQKYRVPYVIEEAAILFESGASNNMDYVVVVDASEKTRFLRIQKRDGLSEEKIKFRLQNQWSTDKLKALADWTIDNNENVLVLPQILHIHKALIKKI